MKEAYWFRFAFFSGFGTFRFMRLASCFRPTSTMSSDALFSLIDMSCIEASYWGPLNALGWVWRLWIAYVEAFWWEEDMVRWRDGGRWVSLAIRLLLTRFSSTISCSY